MGIYKYNESDIGSFSFTDLEVITQGKASNAKVFKYQDFSHSPGRDNKLSEESLRNERMYAEKNQFKIDGVVLESRGLAQQEKNDFEVRVERNVDERLKEIQKNAYEEGFNRGREIGQVKAYEEYSVELDEKLSEFCQNFIQLQAESDKILIQNKEMIYEFIRKFSKWIIFKEIDPKIYLEALLEKLILELNVRRNLIIKVGKDHYEHLPKALEAVQKRVGELPNVRLEIIPEISYPGLILESENSLIDGSLEGVFKTIDKIFEPLVKHDE